MEILIATAIFGGSLVGIIFVSHENSRTKYSKGFWKENNVLIIIAVVVSLLFGGCVYSCLNDTPVDSGFNEWTGEPTNKTPFGY